MDKWFTDELLELAKQKTTQVQVSILRLLEQDNNEVLRKLRKEFEKLVNVSMGPGIGCFYETKRSRVESIVNKLELDKAKNYPYIRLVSKDSAILEAGPRSSERSLPCNHFNMNEFGEDDSNFVTVKEILHEIISEPKRSAILHWGNSVQGSAKPLHGPSRNTSVSSSYRSLEIEKEPQQPGKYFFTSCSRV